MLRGLLEDILNGDDEALLCTGRRIERLHLFLLHHTVPERLFPAGFSVALESRMRTFIRHVSPFVTQDDRRKNAMLSHVYRNDPDLRVWAALDLLVERCPASDPNYEYNVVAILGRASRMAAGMLRAANKIRENDEIRENEPLRWRFLVVESVHLVFERLIAAIVDIREERSNWPRSFAMLDEALENVRRDIDARPVDAYAAWVSTLMNDLDARFERFDKRREFFRAFEFQLTASK